MANLRDLLVEIRRRRVVRDTLVYVAAIWALAQGVAQLSPAFGLPDWTTRWFVIAGAIGFPFWLLLAWYYDITLDGFRREVEPAAGEPARHKPVHRLDYWIFGTMALAIVLLATNQVVLRRDATGRADAADAARFAATVAKLPARSVAVLPLVNESSDPRERYFSDGLSESLINALSQFGGLKVISRHSSFQFRDSRSSPTEIGARLGVANLVEGSVRRHGDRLRIQAVLVHAPDGSIAWSHEFEQPAADLFRVQDAITTAVAEALRVQLLDAPAARPQTDRPQSRNIDAYAAYLRGNAAFQDGSEQATRRAIKEYQTAIRADPHYAAAHAALAVAWVSLADFYLGGEAARSAYASARDAVNTALALDANLAVGYTARAVLLQSADFNWIDAERAARHALQLAPNDGDVRRTVASSLALTGQTRAALELDRQVIETDPQRASAYMTYSIDLASNGQLQAAERAVRTALALRPQADAYHSRLATTLSLQGRHAVALESAAAEPDADWRAFALAFALQAGGERSAADAALDALIARGAEAMAYQIAEVYALRDDADKVFVWLDRALAQRDPGIGNLLGDPVILRFRSDARFAAFCRKAGLPATTDAVALR